jgi:hypothetical protein
VPLSKTHCSDPHEMFVMEGEGYLEDCAKPRFDLVDVHMFEIIVTKFDAKCHYFLIIFSCLLSCLDNYQFYMQELFGFLLCEIYEI